MEIAIPPGITAEDLCRRVQAEDTDRARRLISAAVLSAQEAWVPADCILAALVMTANDLARSAPRHDFFPATEGGSQ